MRLLFVSHSFPPANAPMRNIGGMQRVATELHAALAERDDVRGDAQPLVAPPVPAGPAEARLHLVAEHQAPGTPDDRDRGIEEPRRERGQALVRENRTEHEARETRPGLLQIGDRGGDYRGDLYRADVTGDELSDMTVGVIGYGQVGTRVVRLLRAFGCRILVNDPYIQLDPDDAAAVEELCRKRGWALIVDEVFLGFTLDGGPGSDSTFAASTDCLTFTFGGREERAPALDSRHPLGGVPRMTSASSPSAPSSGRSETSRRIAVIVPAIRSSVAFTGGMWFQTDGIDRSTSRGLKL